jgi:branched-chain amino acid transport system permease protein
MELFPSFEAFIRGTISGLMMGCIFAIIAIGFQLVFGVVKIPEFAHGAVVVWGMYVTWWLGEKFGVDPYLSMIATLPFFFFVGYLLQKLLIVNIMDAREEMQMIFMFGLLFSMMYLAELIFSPNPRFLGKILYLKKPIFWGPFSFHRGLCFSVLVSIIFLVFVSLFLSRSHLGKAIRACADNRFGALIVGLKVRFLYTMAVAIASLLGGLAGTMLMTFSVATPLRAFDMTILSFLIIVLGGFGSFIGVVIGGLIFGLLFSWAKISAFSTFAEAIIYGIMFLFILFKPAGLFGKIESR